MLDIALASHSDELARKITNALHPAALQLTRYANLSELVNAKEASRFDLIVVHHPYVSMDEQASLAFERHLPNATPALALISEQHPECSVPLLNAGIDRCLPETFDPSHFSAVVRALTRRSHGLVTSVTQYGALSFNHATKQIWLHGQEVVLTKREAQVLDILLRRVGQIISKEDFIQEMDPNNFELNHSAVEVYIHRLRKKIPSEHLPIRNIKRCGYFLRRFDSPVAVPTYPSSALGWGLSA